MRIKVVDSSPTSTRMSEDLSEMADKFSAGSVKADRAVLDRRPTSPITAE